jgi:Fic family protein
MRYRGAPPEDCEYLLERLCGWLAEPEFQGTEETKGAFALLRAVIAHLYLAWIHPFGDGNGRTARLMEFKILASAGAPTPAAHLLSNHYNETRSEYYRQLDYASRSGGDVLKFIDYAIQGFVDKLREQLAVIREQQLDVAWRNYVHETFSEDTTQTAMRQRQLLLDLSLQSRPVPKSNIMGISPNVAMSYAGKTAKTMTRDLNDLVDMGLLEVDRGMVRPRKEIIRAFLPERHGPPANDVEQGNVSSHVSMSEAGRKAADQMKQLALPFKRKRIPRPKKDQDE